MSSAVADPSIVANWGGAEWVYGLTVAMNGDQQITYSAVDLEKVGFVGQAGVKLVNGFNGFVQMVTTKGPLGVVDNLANWIAGDLLDCDGDYEELLQQLDKFFGTATQTVLGGPKEFLLGLAASAFVGGPKNLRVSYGDAGSAGGGGNGGGSSGGGEKETYDVQDPGLSSDYNNPSDRDLSGEEGSEYRPPHNVMTR